MEPQITTGASRGTGFDVPAQGLHLRLAGLDGRGREVRRGSIDTSAGTIAIEAVGDELHGWTGDHESDGVPVVDEVRSIEDMLVEVPEQFVALTGAGDRLAGEIQFGGSVVRVKDHDGDIVLGGGRRRI